ncbi:hypothetical protein CAI21_14675 [Alkalilimnicola ehrlichii]|uniref:EamA domain-containing protein n=1 Tax=Alkalilimnicola ehrlichii TaxID=351052 RepID=A0A3E0WQZ2_9GAMM|nr:DMT family transporter [Alkalilimnicola ehrlichii]RFA27285.1 hypothetical protein CAI21_14675 [Alkalilimnicola ehrlichii]RFA34395.1 hypothetical protein CAL65_15245 [Alkalilimnicola ehrlichii]
MGLREYALATLVALLWGGNFVAVKLGTETFPPIFLLALRFTIVAAVMVPFVRRPPRHCWKAVVLVSVALGVFHFGLMFMGIARVDASTAAIATQLGVPFSTVLAVIFFRDVLGWRRILGILVAFSGVAILAGSPQVSGAWGGLLIIVAAAFAWAVANTLIKYLGPLDPFMLTGWMALLAVPQLLLLSFAVEQGQLQSLLTATSVGWAAVIYTAIGSSVVAYTLWYSLINKNPVSQVVPFTLLAPVFGILAAAVILGEPLTLPLVLGGLVTISGVALCEATFRRTRFWGRRRPDVAVAPD